MKRTSIILDRDLVHEAERVLGTQGPTATVHAAMRVAVDQDRRRAAQRRFVERIIAGDLVDPEYAENFWRYRHPEE